MPRAAPAPTTRNAFAEERIATVRSAISLHKAQGAGTKTPGDINEMLRAVERFATSNHGPSQKRSPRNQAECLISTARIIGPQRSLVPPTPIDRFGTRLVTKVFGSSCAACPSTLRLAANILALRLASACWRRVVIAS